MITTENYREIYNELVDETNDFTEESGVVKCTSKKASDIIKEILSGYYWVIDYGISDIEDINGNVYMIIYNDLIDTDVIESLKFLNEKIIKKGSKWQVQSEKGRNLGTYDTKEKAKKRLGQVEFFKQNESIDDNFKLHHSLTEGIPTFWEWLDNQGLDPDVIEENPDLGEYFRQQYDITYNFKTPEDYDLLDTDVPDDYDDFDFYHHEEEIPGYHYVCYYEDDNSPGSKSGDEATLDDAIKMCKGYIDKFNYDMAEIFGPSGATVATFYENNWYTNYNESFNEIKYSENKNPDGTPLGKGTGLGEDYYDKEQEVMIYSCPNCGADLKWLGTQGKYEEYNCDECGEYFYEENGNLKNSSELDEARENRLTKKDTREDTGFNLGESLTETLSGLKVKKKLDVLKELKKDPNYKEDPRWKEFEDELINFYHVDPNEADIDTALYYTEFNWIDANLAMESLDEAKNNTLNPAIWEGEELKPEVKEKLQFIADKFIEKLREDDIPLDVDDIVIVGSNRNYNYGPQSDIDLHIMADLSQFKGREKELAEKIYQAKKSIFNDKYDPMINGFAVEIYVESAEDKNNNDIPDEVE